MAEPAARCARAIALRELSGRFAGSCPRRLRPPIAAIYCFARTADDIADEGERAPAERLADLAAYRADLLAVAAARPPRRAGPRSSARCAARSRASPAGRRCWPTCSTPSSRTCAKHALRRPRRAARLLPPLGQPGRPPAAAPVRRRRRRRAARSPTRSAARCSSTNFWQDLERRHRARPPLRAASRLRAPRRRRSPSCCARPRRRPRSRAAGRRAGRLGARADAATARRSCTPCRAAPAGSCASWCRAGCASSRRSSALGGATLARAARRSRWPTRRCSPGGARCAMRAPASRRRMSRRPRRDDARAVRPGQGRRQRLELLLRLPVPAAAAPRRDHRLLCLLPRGRRRGRRGHRPRRRRDQAGLVAQRGRRSLRRPAAAIR